MSRFLESFEQCRALLGEWLFVQGIVSGKPLASDRVEAEGESEIIECSHGLRGVFLAAGRVY